MVNRVFFLTLEVSQPSKYAGLVVGKWKILMRKMRGETYGERKEKEGWSLVEEHQIQLNLRKKKKILFHKIKVRYHRTATPYSSHIQYWPMSQWSSEIQYGAYLPWSWNGQLRCGWSSFHINYNQSWTNEMKETIQTTLFIGTWIH